MRIRLYPLTIVTSKLLLPVYDKLMIYSHLYTLMFVGIKEVLIVFTPTDLPCFNEHLDNGSLYGISLYYYVQLSPDRLA